MKTRIVSGIIGAIVLFVVLFSGEIIFNIAVGIISLIAIYELLKACGIQDKKPLFIAGLIADLAITLTMVLGFNPLYTICIFIGVLFILLMTNREKNMYEDICKTLFSTMYVSLFMGHLILIRALDKGVYLVWIVILCAFLTDIFAYFGGSLFGKTKLCPKLSPKKTVEGAISGVAGSLLGMLVYGYILKSAFGFSLDFIELAVVAVITSVVSQLGDLSASSIKRQYGIKDYGNIMPGHGGAMDRFDSIMFAAPFVYFILTVLPVI